MNIYYHDPDGLNPGYIALMGCLCSPKEITPDTAFKRMYAKTEYDEIESTERYNRRKYFEDFTPDFIDQLVKWRKEGKSWAWMSRMAGCSPTCIRMNIEMIMRATG